MANWRRITGAAGLVVGATAAGAGALVAAERIAVSRIRSGTGHHPGDEPFGTLRGRELTVLAQDGVALHVEINGPDAAPVTIIFCHGYTVNQDCWHFQRRDLAEHRLVFWDQRDHGRSGRSKSGSATIDELGADLKAVIDAAAPRPGPRHPGRSLHGRHDDHGPGGAASRHVRHQDRRGRAHLHRGPGAGSRQPVDARPGQAADGPRAPLRAERRGQGARPPWSSGAARSRPDLAFLVTRMIGFGDGEVSPATVGFLDQMIRATPIEVVAQVRPRTADLDMRGSLTTLGRVPVVVMVGEKDRLVAPRLGIELAAEIPGAQLIWVPGGGHALILERPDLVSDTIAALLGRVNAGGGLPRSA